jgi:hypothetical protein
MSRVAENHLTALESPTLAATAQVEFDKRYSTSNGTKTRERTGAFGVFVSRVLGEPQYTNSFRNGADSEREIAASLERHTADKQILWLHDRVRPDGDGTNIDHIAIGRGGVTVIDSRNLKGNVSLQTGGMFGPRMDQMAFNNRDQNKLVTAVERQIDAVRALLTATGFGHADVRGALCMNHADGLPIFSALRVRGVLIDGTRSVAALASRSGELNSEMIAVLHAQLKTGTRAA